MNHRLPRLRLAAAGAVALLLGTGLVAASPAIAGAAATVGASTPFTSYEAEAGALGGGASVVSVTSAPATQYSSPALEASGHAYVSLDATGESVRWTNTTGAPVSFVNLRLSIPDPATGGGATATLDLLVNGTFRQALNVNSKQTWLYEGANYNGNDQDPALGDPRVFYDEAHAFISGDAVAPGDTITLQKDATNTATSYHLDVIDVENPPAPLAQPAGSLSITDCGAVSDPSPTNGSADSHAVDSTTAIQTCINQAQTQNRTLWIPPGTFYLIGTGELRATGITIAGAGLWYSTIYRSVPLPNTVNLGAIFNATSTTLKNFHLDANATSRATVDGDGGAMDTTGTNWIADHLWVQHTESGIWASGTGGTLSNSRFTSIWADGINLNNVSNGGTVGTNITATNNFVRSTGDDALAINSVDYNTFGDTTYRYTPMSNVTLTGNTLIAPWGGKGLSVYGGSGHIVENNYIADTARYIGLGIGRFGVNGSDLTSATVSGNTIVRSGGNGYNQGQPALQIGNGGDGQNVGVINNVTVSGNTVTDPLYDGIGFSTSTNTLLKNNTVTGPGRNGIVISPPFYPAPTGSATITGNTVTGRLPGTAPYRNNSTGFTATLSDNSWKGDGSTPIAISLRAHATDEYVTTGTDGSQSLIAGSPSIGPAETFDLITNTDGSIGLLAHANQQYVTAESGGAAALIANRTGLGSWESFDLIRNLDGSISLRAHANNQYVTAGPSPLIASRTSIGSAESFDLIED
jgi:hypothetical protein